MNNNTCNNVIIGGRGTGGCALTFNDHYLTLPNSVIIGGRDICQNNTGPYTGRPKFSENSAFLQYPVITNHLKLSEYTTVVGTTGFGGTNSFPNVLLNQKQSGFSNYISFWGSSGVRQRFRICP